MEQDQSSIFNLSIDSYTASTIQTSTQWARILSICGIIMGIFVCLVSFLVPSIMRNSMRNSDYRDSETRAMESAMSSGLGIVIVLYVIVGGLIILGNIFLLNYANKTSTALKNNDSALLSAGMVGLKNYFLFWGIIMIISLLFTLLGVFGIVMAA